MSLVTYGALGSDPNGVKTYNHDGSVHYVLDVYAVVLSLAQLTRCQAPRHRHLVIPLTCGGIAWIRARCSLG
jgi:hypothetical protein